MFYAESAGDQLRRTQGREELDIGLILAPLPTLKDNFSHPSLVQLAQQSAQTQPPPLAAFLPRGADHHQMQRGESWQWC
jgi:hypothetical protein